jgi:hypothetical protein
MRAYEPHWSDELWQKIWRAPETSTAAQRLLKHEDLQEVMRDLPHLVTIADDMAKRLAL